jgi:hypothetical protein
VEEALGTSSAWRLGLPAARQGPPFAASAVLHTLREYSHGSLTHELRINASGIPRSPLSRYLRPYEYIKLLGTRYSTRFYVRHRLTACGTSLRRGTASFFRPLSAHMIISVQRMGSRSSCTNALLDFQLSGCPAAEVHERHS